VIQLKQAYFFSEQVFTAWILRSFLGLEVYVGYFDCQLTVETCGGFYYGQCICGGRMYRN